MTDIAESRETRPSVAELGKIVDRDDNRLRLVDLGAMFTAIVNRSKRSGRAVLGPEDASDIEAIIAIYDRKLA